MISGIALEPIKERSEECFVWNTLWHLQRQPLKAVRKNSNRFEAVIGQAADVNFHRRLTAQENGFVGEFTVRRCSQGRQSSILVTYYHGPIANVSCGNKAPIRNDED